MLSPGIDTVWQEGDHNINSSCIYLAGEITSDFLILYVFISYTFFWGAHTILY